jgi:hypothetical protein
MQRDRVPWTGNQMTLAAVAIFLAICCFIILTINKIHNQIIVPASEDSVAHLMFALGAKSFASTRARLAAHFVGRFSDHL